MLLADAESAEDAVENVVVVDRSHDLAEGVERQDQLALVRGVGCALGQGWLWARPMPIGDVGTLLGP